MDSADANDTDRTSNSSSSRNQLAYRWVQMLIGLGLVPLVCLVGIVCNILCVLIFAKRKLRTSTNIYLLTLSFGDLMKLVNDLMYTPSVICKYFFAGSEDVIYVNYYQVGYFLSQYASTVAAWMTVAVAFERFLMIVFPTTCRGALTVGKATFASALIALLVLLVNIPIGLRYEKVPVLDVNASQVQLTLNVTQVWTKYLASSYSNFQSSFRCIVPLVILTVLNACIIVNVRKTRANRRLAARNRITLMLVIVICLFIAFALPDAAMTLYGLGYHEVNTDAQRIVREITDFLLTLNSAHNFFLYMFFNSIFFEVCFGTFCRGVNETDRKARIGRRRSERSRRRRRGAGCLQEGGDLEMQRPQQMQSAVSVEENGGNVDDAVQNIEIN